MHLRAQPSLRAKDSEHMVSLIELLTLEIDKGGGDKNNNGYLLPFVSMGYKDMSSDRVLGAEISAGMRITDHVCC